MDNTHAYKHMHQQMNNNKATHTHTHTHTDRQMFKKQSFLDLELEDDETLKSLIKRKVSSLVLEDNANWKTTATTTQIDYNIDTSITIDYPQQQHRQWLQLLSSKSAPEKKNIVQRPPNCLSNINTQINTQTTQSIQCNQQTYTLKHSTLTIHAPYALFCCMDNRSIKLLSKGTHT